MSIDFHAQDNRYTYATRTAADDWAEMIRTLVDPVGKRVADIGCGGGIYSAAWADLGATQVIGVDFSEPMIGTAREKNGARAGLTFQTGRAEASGLPDASVDIVFERALIHHLADYTACCREAHRLLAPGGCYVIQDRTLDDVRVPGSPDHPRGYFFDRFPQLLDTESRRRPAAPAVEAALRAAGFTSIQVTTFWETRKHYLVFDALAQDLRGRVGRSLLHELTDADLDELIAFLAAKLPTGTPITERDRWTVWACRKA